MRTCSFSGSSRSSRARIRSCDTAISRYTNRATAPDEFTSQRKIVSGQSAAKITEMYPTEVASRIARAGTPRELIFTVHCGASPRLASANNIREAT